MRFCKTPADDESLCAMGPSNVWPENEDLPTQSIKLKFETHTVKLEFVYSAHSNRRWDLIIWLRPWDQTTNYAVEACQFSKPSEVQDAGISWQDNCTVFWDAEDILPTDYIPHKVTITGAYYADLLCKLLITSKENRQGNLTQVPVVLHDNAPVRSHILDRLLYLNGF